MKHKTKAAKKKKKKKEIKSTGPLTLKKQKVTRPRTGKKQFFEVGLTYFF